MESHTRSAASHGFHDGVGKVLFQRWGNEQVDCIVYIDQFLLATDVIEWVDLERNQRCQLFGVLAIYYNAQFFRQCRIFFGQGFARLNEIVYPFPFVRNLGGAEKNQALVGRKAELLPGFLLVSGFEQVGIDRVGYVDDFLIGEQGALAGSLFQPSATSDKGNGSQLV